MYLWCVMNIHESGNRRAQRTEPQPPSHHVSQSYAMNISVAERATVDAYLGRLARNVKDLAERLEMLKTGLRVPPSLARPPGQRAASLDHRSR